MISLESLLYNYVTYVQNDFVIPRLDQVLSNMKPIWSLLIWDRIYVGKTVQITSSLTQLRLSSYTGAFETLSQKLA